VNRHEAELKIEEIAKEAGLQVIISSPLGLTQSHLASAWRSLIEARNASLRVGKSEITGALNSHLDLVSLTLAKLDRYLYPDDYKGSDEGPEFKETPPTL